VDSQAQDIVTWAEKQTESKLHKGKGSKLTIEQVSALTKLRAIGKSQTEIAQAIGCDQGTVSRWLADLTDTSDLAGAYLRGQALRMARNIVRKGLARDHIQALKGISVLAEDTAGQGLVIQIGIKDSDVTFACSTQQLSSPKQQLTVETESDKTKLC
jgi:hypothetical protein